MTQLTGVWYTPANRKSRRRKTAMTSVWNRSPEGSGMIHIMLALFVAWQEVVTFGTGSNPTLKNMVSLQASRKEQHALLTGALSIFCSTYPAENPSTRNSGGIKMTGPFSACQSSRCSELGNFTGVRGSWRCWQSPRWPANTKAANSGSRLEHGPCYFSERWRGGTCWPNSCPSKTLKQRDVVWEARLCVGHLPAD